MPKSKARLFCFCGPPGAGKSTICSTLIEEEPRIKLSISTTTRAPRGEEEDGVHYHFVDKPTFEDKIKNGEFIEHATFNGQYYGTEKSTIEKVLVAESCVLLDIDVQGVQQMKKLFPDNLITVFVKPPSFEILEQRLRERSTESETQIEARLKIAKEEMEILSKEGFSDYVIENNNLSRTLAKAREIVAYERAYDGAPSS